MIDEVNSSVAMADSLFAASVMEKATGVDYEVKSPVFTEPLKFPEFLRRKNAIETVLRPLERFLPILIATDDDRAAKVGLESARQKVADYEKEIFEDVDGSVKDLVERSFRNHCSMFRTALKEGTPRESIVEIMLSFYAKMSTNQDRQLLGKQLLVEAEKQAVVQEREKMRVALLTMKQHHILLLKALGTEHETVKETQELIDKLHKMLFPSDEILQRESMALTPYASWSGATDGSSGCGDQHDTRQKVVSHKRGHEAQNLSDSGRVLNEQARGAAKSQNEKATSSSSSEVPKKTTSESAANSGEKRDSSLQTQKPKVPPHAHAANARPRTNSAMAVTQQQNGEHNNPRQQVGQWIHPNQMGNVDMMRAKQVVLPHHQQMLHQNAFFATQRPSQFVRPPPGFPYGPQYPVYNGPVHGNFGPGPMMPNGPMIQSPLLYTNGPQHPVHPLPPTPPPPAPHKRLPVFNHLKRHIQ